MLNNQITNWKGHGCSLNMTGNIKRNKYISTPLTQKQVCLNRSNFIIY